jgi:DtxR family Mn-dependent transcriptional regulator
LGYRGIGMRRKTVEEYIETIYGLEKKNKIASTGEIASHLKIRPSSVTEMLQKLEIRGLIEYKPYYGVALTDEGRKIAKTLDKKHKILAEFFHKVLGVKKEIAEKDACEIEHHVSKDTIKKLIEFIQLNKK